MSKPYEIYRLPADGNWVRVEIVAETPSGRDQGIVDYKREFDFHDARVEHTPTQPQSCGGFTVNDFVEAFEQ